MKYLFALILLSPFLCAAQGKFEGFWGIPFGETKTNVIAKVKADKGVSPAKEINNDVYYKNVSFGGEENCILVLSFTKGDRLYKGFVKFNYNETEDILEGYYHFKEKLIEKYGVPQKSIEDWPSHIQPTNYFLMEHAIRKETATFLTYYNTIDLTGRDVIIFLAIKSGDPIGLTFLATDKLISEAIQMDKDKEEGKDF